MISKSQCMLFFILFASFFLNAQSEVEIIPTIKNSEIKDFPIKPGKYNHAFKMTDGELWNIHAKIPESKKGKKAPLVIALHWAGNDEAYLEYSECLAFPAFDTLDAFVIAPSADGLQWVDRKNEKRLVRLIKQLIKYWPVDPDRIIITGYSNGGIGAWRFANKYSKLFAAAIPIAGFYKSHEIKIPTYVLHGEKDDLFAMDEMKSNLESCEDPHSLLQFKTLTGFSHYMACDYLEELKAMVEKMRINLENKQRE